MTKDDEMSKGWPKKRLMTKSSGDRPKDDGRRGGSGQKNLRAKQWVLLFLGSNSIGFAVQSFVCVKALVSYVPQRTLASHDCIFCGFFCFCICYSMTIL